MSKAALDSKTRQWKAMTPISVEQGFDLLTETGRNKAERHLREQKPDLIIAQWMCDPFSSRQNVNIARGGITAENILEKRKTHTKLNDWIARQERWQRTQNKGHWLGEQPQTCGSWKLQSTQEMQQENYNIVFDMCNEGAAALVDPPTGLPIRKRTKLNHSSGILHGRFKDSKCPDHDKHKIISGQTKYKLPDGSWKTINTSVFAG